MAAPIWWPQVNHPSEHHAKTYQWVTPGAPHQFVVILLVIAFVLLWWWGLHATSKSDG